MTSLKGIFFDFDGTIADTDPVHLQMYKEILAPLGIEVDELFFRQNIAGGSNKEILKRFFPDITDEEAEKRSEEKEESFRYRVTELQVNPGLYEILQWIAQNLLKLALVTNAPKRNIDYLLPLLKLEKTFKVQITGEDCERGKPYPDPYLLALKQTDLRAESVIVFEDSKTGIRSAKEAGIFVIGLTTTHTKEELLNAGADFIIHDYRDKELWDLLSGRMQSP